MYHAPPLLLSLEVAIMSAERGRVRDGVPPPDMWIKTLSHIYHCIPLLILYVISVIMGSLSGHDKDKVGISEIKLQLRSGKSLSYFYGTWDGLMSQIKLAHCSLQ